MRKRRTRGTAIGRGIAAVLALLFGYAVYVYLTVPDVRPLRTTVPETVMKTGARWLRGR